MTRLPSALTQTERRLLAILFRRESELMLPPTVRELAAALGSSQMTVCTALESLRDRGMVTWERDCSRTLRLTCRLVPVAPDTFRGR